MKTNNQTIRNLLLILALAGLSLSMQAQNAWINEIHYDNTGTDAGEIIEVAIESAGSYNLADFSVVLYNGVGGVTYDTKTLNLFTAGSSSGNFSLFYYPYPSNGIQNGAPDGMALVYQGAVITGQFLSYEGTMTATNGPANGMLSVDIGVLEAGTEPLGKSLQLSGAGEVYSDFAWQGPANATPGALNNGQTFVAAGVANPANFNAVASSTTQNDLSWALNANNDSVLIAYNSSLSFGSPTGVYAAGGSISGGGTVLYKGTGTTASHTGLTPNTEYYYKAWSFTPAHTYSAGVVDSSTTLKIEPTNYPTAYAVTVTGITAANTWTDAAGAQLPDGYLIKISDQNNISAPTDGTAVADDRDVSDGAGAINVAFGVGSFTFFRLEETTTYYFKIYPYTNSGTGINYKTDGTAPSGNGVTQSILNTNDFESNTFGTWTTYSVATIKNWTVNTGTGAYATTHYTNINGYQTPLDTLENDWLISPSLNLIPYTNEKIIFFSWWNFSTETNELKLKYSTDYISGDPTTATWTELAFTKPANSQTWLPSGFIDLSSISGTNVHIAFHYLSTVTPRSWSVDEIEITGIGVSNPTNFNASTVSSTEIGLTWNKNNNNNNVMVAYNTTNAFGTPIPGFSYPVSATMIGGGTVIYNGPNESYNHTGRNPATTYYYKAWSVDGSNIYSSGVTDNAATQFPEPTNHPTGFAATANGFSTITVSWTDSDAGHYLVKGSSIGYSSIVPPVDGIGQGDSLLVKNVSTGVQTQLFSGLTPNTTYFFRIFPYNGTGEASNYKTNGTIPQASAATSELNLDLIISEIVDPADKAFAKYVELTNAGESAIDFTATPIYLCKQVNGGAWESVKIAGTIAAGGNHVITSSDTSFNNNYGIPASQISSKINGNGDDGYYLYYGGDQASGILMDAYGIMGEDGTGTPWDYENSHAVRKRYISAPNASWDSTEWVIMNAGVKSMTPFFHKGNVTWQGNTSTNWNTKSNNWSSPNGYIPDASCIVNIPNVTSYPIITEPSACHELQIQTNSTLSIQGTGSLLIVGP